MAGVTFSSIRKAYTAHWDHFDTHSIPISKPWPYGGRRQKTETCVEAHMCSWRPTLRGPNWEPRFGLSVQSRDGPWPDSTWAYFWPAVNKRPTCLWHGYFLTQPKEIFLTRRENLKNLTFLGEIFQTKPKPLMADPTQVKNFWPWPITSSIQSIKQFNFLPWI